MKTPRDLSGSELAKALGKLGYIVTRQSGSHLRSDASGPISTMGGFCPVTGTERCDKQGHEFILRLLRQGHPQQSEMNWCWSLADVMNEAGITREAKIEFGAGQLVKSPVVQALHAQSVDRLGLVPLRTQGIDQFSRQVLVEQDSHAG